MSISSPMHRPYNSELHCIQIGVILKPQLLFLPISTTNEKFDRWRLYVIIQHGASELGHAMLFSHSWLGLSIFLLITCCISKRFISSFRPIHGFWPFLWLILSPHWHRFLLLIGRPSNTHTISVSFLFLTYLLVRPDNIHPRVSIPYLLIYFCPCLPLPLLYREIHW